MSAFKISLAIGLGLVALVVLTVFAQQFKKPFAYPEGSVSKLAGNYTVIDDVQGKLLVGFKEPYRGAEDDNEALNRYYNKSYYSKLGLLEPEIGESSLKRFSFKGGVTRVDGQPSKERFNLTRFLAPCYSHDDQKIYQIAHKFKKGAYYNQGERVLLSISPDGAEYELYTAEILGTGYIEGYDPFYLSPFKGCRVEVAKKYVEVAEKSCGQMNLPFTCYEAPENSNGVVRFEVQDLDFTGHDTVQLIGSTERREEWPLTVNVIKPDGEQQTVLLPVGPFIKDGDFFKDLSCFSCGCSCYQHLNMALIGDDLHLIASGWAIDDEHRGIYRLAGDAWEQVLSLPENARYFEQVGECTIAWVDGGDGSFPFENKQVSWANLCRE